MKKIAIILLALSGNIYAATDYTCQNRCLNQGSTWSYCKSACSYNDGWNTTIKRTDYACQNKCTSMGYTYGYCKEACSY